eukprot:CAMPEP_0172797902 /NCGR_PEP_ID=MMETSP1075-20121228/735_1 /TAXON_ID=2916 /ORGANISM="Ceratium fusus, Strain PA161109" /LENGTH=250 /DNA_ID=CAMNT_0013635231 /DNA_START=63 /DNA_END=815 /DNA_ORIENTATION=+
MKLVIAAAVFGLGAANIANPEHKTCLDIKAMCKDGSDKAGCERQEAKDLKKGANLQMWNCHDKKNQLFELKNGRWHNTLTGLCIDIKADCVDGKEKAGCKRQALEDIKDDANVQLWTCREDNEKGFASSSYGNQKFDLMNDGTIRNEATNLCLTVDESKKEKANGANVKVATCKTDDPNQLFIFRSEIDATKPFTRLVEVQDATQLRAPTANGSPAAFAALAVGACASVVLAAVAFIRSRRSTSEAIYMD